MKQLEYIEGQEAAENFERMATAVFQAPKADDRESKKNAEPSKPAKPRKKKRSDKD